MKPDSGWWSEAREVGLGGDVERLVSALEAADPSAEPPGPAARERALVDVWEAARPTSAAAAWLAGLVVAPARGVAVAIAAVIAAFALSYFGPALTLGRDPLLWAGLLSPWAGVGWALVITWPRRGVWADWQAMAPVPDIARATADWAAATAFGAALAAALEAVFGLPGGFGPVWMIWTGPFALGSAVMATVTWRWGLGYGLLASTAIWGVPAALAVGGGTHLEPAVTAALLWYAQAPGAHGQLAADALAAVAAVLVVVAVGWQGRAWTSR